MDETIRELYRHREKAFERQITLVEMHLQFVNWLFGIASATLFSALAIIRTSEISELCIILRPETPALMAALVTFIALFFTYKAKTEGNRSIEGVLEQLTYLDVQAASSLDENRPEPKSQYDSVMDFMNDKYLEPNAKYRMDELNKLPERIHTELYWQRWLYKSVATSLLFLFVSVCLYIA
jgi:hypothetical protein